MLVQGALLFLVGYFGNVNPEINVLQINQETYTVTVVAPQDVENANIKTEDGIATFAWADATTETTEPVKNISFSIEAGKEYVFEVKGEAGLTADNIRLINQKEGV
ncbi:MAG: hypothetical protein R3B93_27510 [Bacteroidia bacterium]